MGTLHIGETIRDLRKSKGITQEQLAEVLGLSTPAVSKWESGQTCPDIATLPILARYFGVNMDFLFGFSSVLSDEEVKTICDELAERFDQRPFEEALQDWEDALRQFPLHDKLRYDLATLGVFHLIKAGSEEVMLQFVEKIIRVLETCRDSEVLKIKQGAYFQIANLHIALGQFEKAEAALDQIPAPTASQKLLRSMIQIRKGDLAAADKATQETIFDAVSEIIGALGHKISILYMSEPPDIEAVMELYDIQKKLISIFGLEPRDGVALNLMIAMGAAQMEQYERAKAELEQAIELLERYPINMFFVWDIPFFKDVEAQEIKSTHPRDTYRMLFEQLFPMLDEAEDVAFEEIKVRLTRAVG